MKNEVSAECPRCGNIRLHLPLTHGTAKELAVRIEYLEQRLFDLAEENKNLRKLYFTLHDDENNTI